MSLTEAATDLAATASAATHDDDIPQPDPHCDADNSYSLPVESLPAELRLQILLHIPDLDTLRSLLHASPLLYAQYRQDRHVVLRACLKGELSGFTTDAYALVKSRGPVLGSPRTGRVLGAFVRDFTQWHTNETQTPDILSLQPTEVRWLARYHMRVARPLCNMLSLWMQSNLRVFTGTELWRRNMIHGIFRQVEEYGLSNCEMIRIFRALYRHDTFHQLFGLVHGELTYRTYDDELNGMFMCIFDPWEVEGIGVVDLFLRHSYDQIFEKVKADFQPDGAQAKSQDGLRINAVAYDFDKRREVYIDRASLRGLRMLALALMACDHKELVLRVGRILERTTELESTLESCMTCYAQDTRRSESDVYPDSRDILQESRSSMLSDSVQDGGIPDSPDLPPFGWVCLWNGTYANIYGAYVPWTVRRTGYVFWDEDVWPLELGGAIFTWTWQKYSYMADRIQDKYSWSPLDGVDVNESKPFEEPEETEGFADRQAERRTISVRDDEHVEYF